MIKITDITLKRAYRRQEDGSILQPFECNVTLQVGEDSYKRADVKLTDDQTAAIAEHIAKMVMDAVSISIMEPKVIPPREPEAIVVAYNESEAHMLSDVEEAPL